MCIYICREFSDYILEYAFPNDEIERERLDMQHAMHTLLLEHKLFWAPIGDNPSKILDLGTGTGAFLNDLKKVTSADEGYKESGQLIARKCFQVQWYGQTHNRSFRHLTEWNQ